MSARETDAKNATSRKAASEVYDWPNEGWPLLIEYLVRGEDYVLCLESNWRVSLANDSYRRSIASFKPGGGGEAVELGSFLDRLEQDSSDELVRLATADALDGAQVELKHGVSSGIRTVQYSFRRLGEGWIVIGRDQSVQLELVKQMSVLVEELEAKVKNEKALSKDLRALAERDHLTGLPNRRSFERELADAQRAFWSEGRGFSVFCIDVDNYKQVNDKYGHPVGDKVLQYVASVLEESIRDGDRAARCGGDEFVVVVRGVEVPQSLELAERLRQRIETLEMPEPVEPLSVSIGIASTQHDDPSRAKRLLQLADGALYSAKENGRNRVVVAE